MSNIFKSNSRFSSLMDDIPLKKDLNKNKEPKKVLQNSNGGEFNSSKSEKIIVKESKDMEERSKFSSEHFPELVISSKKTATDTKQTVDLTYIEKLKKVDDTKICIDPDLENLKPGCVLLKRDPLTGRTLFKSHPEIIVEEKEKTEKEIAIDILNVLVESYKKRTQEYIENYGYEEWERMFKFPNWREEEAYLEQMDEMVDNNDYEDDDYDNNYDYDSVYDYDYDNPDDH